MPTRRRYHFHTPGLVYIFITLLIAVGAFNSQNNLLFWAFGFALAILLVSGLISGQMLMGIRAERRLPARAVVGETLELAYRIRNRSRIVPAFAIGIAEMEMGDGPASGGAAPDRGPRWRRLLRLPAATVRAFTFLVHLGPRESAEITARITPDRRGVLRFSDFGLETTFPFGIVRKSLLFRQPRTVLVRPRPTTPPADLFSRRRSGGQTATPRATQAGTGDDFFTLREYVAGDSPRTIAWRASARGEHVLVRQNSRPIPQRLIVLLRLDPAQAEAVNEAAISLGAGVIDAATRAGYEVGLIVPAAALERRPSTGRAHAAKLLDDLALLDLAGAARAAPVPHGAARGTIVVTIHAGPIDTAFGPHGATHLSAAAPSSLPEPELATPARGTHAPPHSAGASQLSPLPGLPRRRAHAGRGRA